MLNNRLAEKKSLVVLSVNKEGNISPLETVNLIWLVREVNLSLSPSSKIRLTDLEGECKSGGR